MRVSADQVENYLDYIPIRRAKYEPGDEGRLVLLQPRPMTGILTKFLQKKLPVRIFRIKLDEIGTNVWQLVDGAHTVGEIADILSEKMGEKIEPRYERIAIFIRELYRQGMVSFSSETQDRT